MKSEIKKNCLLLGISLLLACTSNDNNSGSHRVRIPLDDGNGHYALQTVELKTTVDMSSLSGTAVDMRTGGRFQISQMAEGKQQLLGYDLGTVPTAHFLNVDGVLHPADFKTLAMSAVAYHFENIKTFFDVIGGNDGLRFPRMILFDVSVAELKGGLVKESIDNASYESHLDMFWLNPFKSSNVPISINGGVLAHEYFHSIFAKRLQAWQQKLNKKDLPGIDAPENGKAGHEINLGEWSSAAQAPQSDQLPALAMKPILATECGLPVKSNGDVFEPEDYRRLNTFIFASLNEGVADYFGYEYSHNPSWIDASLPSQHYRDLNLSKTFEFTDEDQKCLLYMNMKKSGSKQVQTDPHLVGSFFSHLFYLTSQEWGSIETQKAVLDFIDRFSEAFLNNFDTHFMSVGEVVKLFFVKRPPEGILCDKVHDIFHGELNEFNYGCKGSEDLPPATVVSPTGDSQGGTEAQ